MIATPITLLERLRGAHEPAAWERFVRLYTPLLCHWARRLGLRGPDIADLVQDIFTVLVQELPLFRYDTRKRFRGWLWTITRNKCREKARKLIPLPIGGANELGDAVAIPDDTTGFDEVEYRAYLVKRALQLSQAGFQADTWQAFWECVVVGRPVAEVARQLGMTENAVYLAKGRVLRRLRADLDGLLE